MSPEVAAAAEELFFTTKELDKGTGLGLPMVKDFARRSEGDIRIATVQGVGTTVDIILPRADVANRGAQIANGAAHAEPIRGDAEILLVDDDEQFRRLTATSLRNLGYSVVEAGSAESAYALAHSVSTLDLVITDFAMSGATGLEFASRLSAERPTLPILFVTGHPDDLHAQVHPVVSKPFSIGDLSRAIFDLLRSHGARPPSVTSSS